MRLLPWPQVPTTRPGLLALASTTTSCTWLRPPARMRASMPALMSSQVGFWAWTDPTPASSHMANSWRGS